MVAYSLLINIDRSSKTPIRRQIVEKIRILIDEQVIAADTPLPSTRALADRLGISRYTVNLAYEELQVMGYLQSRQGSYNYTQKRRKEVEYNPERRSIIAWDKAANKSAEKLYKSYLGIPAGVPNRFRPDQAVIDFSELQPDPSLFPIADFRRCFRRVMLEDGQESLDFSPTEGNKNLRDYIAQRLRLHGISSSAEEILITYGSQQALDYIIRLLTRPDKKVIVEAPTYFNILPLLKFHNVKLSAVPMKPDGMDLNYLEKVLQREKVSFIYTIPNFHNPTGITTSHTHREKLLNICLNYRIPILEDGFEEEMKYFGKLPMPIKSIDEKNLVIYVGTFSKVLFPGVRIGWVTADKGCIQRLAAIKRCSDLRCGNLVQAALALFCKEGYYDLHLKRIHRIFRRRMQTALRMMSEFLPKNVGWSQPLGGFTIWVKMPRKMSAADLSKLMFENGVIVSPGEHYFPQLFQSEYFRLSIARIDEVQIKEGLIRLGGALRKLSN